MARWFGWILQAAAYAAFVAALGYLSILPRYEYASPDQAQVKVSLNHAAQRVEPCVQLTPQQVAELPPNMRRTEQCERRRLPLSVEIAVDDAVVLRVEARPSGLWEDGPASVYERFTLPPGPHRVTARLRDSDRSDGWDYERTDEVVMQSGRYFTITFSSATGGFSFR